ncbi:MAG: Fur family transcriptional regulator [Polynucleobacter sp.]|jgi:Fur family ferric uptake transcriptional regulator
MRFNANDILFAIRNWHNTLFAAMISVPIKQTDTAMERKTRQYQAIFEVIAHGGGPLLAQEIQELAAKTVPQLSLATVYRQIKSLLEDGSIRQVQLPGQNPRYEIGSHEHDHDHGHHHYFQCRRCEKVFDVPTCPGNLDKLAPAGFMVEDHEIILYGRCGECAGENVMRKH